MAVFKPMIIQKNETDIGKVVRQLYRFSEDLKYTISNLSLEDNISNDVLNSITDRNNKVRKIQFSTDALNIEYDDYASSVQTKLSQSSESIQLLVATGNVVHLPPGRMHLCTAPESACPTVSPPILRSYLNKSLARYNIKNTQTRTNSCISIFPRFILNIP